MIVRNFWNRPKIDLLAGRQSEEHQALRSRPRAKGIGRRGLLGGLAATGLISSAPKSFARLGGAQFITSTYLGQLTTGCYAPDQTWPSSSAVQANCQSVHIARTTITQIQCEYANFSTYTEAGPGAPLFLNVHLVYNGVAYPMVWSGAGAVIASGQLSGLSDVLDLKGPYGITIPAGSIVYMRVFAQCTGGLPLKPIAFTPVNGQGTILSLSGQTDQSGTPGTSLTPFGPCIMPVALVGPTTHPAGILIGDSICAGTGETFGNLSADVGVLGRSIGRDFPYINLACGGETMALFNSSPGNRISLAQYGSFFAIEMGHNDLATVTAATLLTRYATLIAYLQTNFPGKPIFITTLTPQSTDSTSSSSPSTAWTTPLPQTPTTTTQAAATGNAWHTQRGIWDAWVRAGMIPGMTGSFDLAAAAEANGMNGIVDSDIWYVDPLGHQSTADGNHPTSYIEQRVMELGVVDPAKIWAAVAGIN